MCLDFFLSQNNVEIIIDFDPMESIFVDFMGQLIHEFWNLTKNNVFFPLINNTVDIFVCIFLGSTKLRTHWDCFNEQSKKIGINEFKNLHSVILNVQIYVCFLFELMYCVFFHILASAAKHWFSMTSLGTKGYQILVGLVDLAHSYLYSCHS